MALSSGTRLGVYQVNSLLGAGGMGEVYEATDTKLGRRVAIKVLPELLWSDADRIARFEREAIVLAALNHPNIAALYGMEESEGRHFLVMELVDGDTLADRLRRGPLLVAEALRIAGQIAEALEGAHEKSIVHRDLKPANIKITTDGKVKVLDFGLAKALETAPSTPANLTHSPTLSVMGTQAGMILGTAAYMSPEQAKGMAADARSDVFSFGVVLYEMIAGRQPFLGETVPDILASVLAREPDLASLPPLNPRLVDLLKRCLDKNPKRRWQAIGDLRAEIEAIAAAPESVPLAGVPVKRPLWQRATATGAAMMLGGAVTAAAFWYFTPAPEAPTVARFPFVLPEDQAFTQTARQVLDVSPDGTRIVYAANRRLYLRSMAELEGRPIPGPDLNPANPTFSPDGRFIVFAAGTDQTLKKVAVTGGAAVTLSPLSNPPYGISWAGDSILFAQGPGSQPGTSGILRVSANSGTPELLVALKEGETVSAPRMLPGNKAVLFTLAVGSALDWDRAQVVVQTLSTGERKTLVAGGSDGRFLPPDHLVYALGGTLFAVPFDPDRLEVTGGPASILEGVRRSILGTAQFSFSRNGAMTYVPGPAGTLTSGGWDLGLLDPKGVVEPLKLPPGPYEVPRVSRDGTRVAFGSDDGKDAVVYIYELSGKSQMRRLTLGGRNRFPIWSSDGTRVAFQSDREGDLSIFWQPADGNGQAERLTTAGKGTVHIPESWSPAGDAFLFSEAKGTDRSLWLFSLKDRKATPFGSINSKTEIGATFSPDGHWVVYTSDAETGVAQIFIQPYPATGVKYPVSKDGGHHPMWTPDGAGLTYDETAGRSPVVGVTLTPSFNLGAASLMLRGSLYFNNAQIVRPYDMVRDGRIVGRINAPTGAGGPERIEVVLNWFEDLKGRLPTR